MNIETGGKYQRFKALPAQKLPINEVNLLVHQAGSALNF